MQSGASGHLLYGGAVRAAGAARPRGAAGHVDKATGANMEQQRQSPSEVPAGDSARALLASFHGEEARVRLAGPVATGSECDAFRRWIDGLTGEGNEALVQVRECGFTYDLAALRLQ